MQLQNFECQIAKAQIGRFVAGDPLSDESLRQLESHVASCSDCQQNLAERRAVLQALLSPQSDAKAPQVEAVSNKPAGFAALIKSKIGAGQTVQAAVHPSNPIPAAFAKPAIYSLALGVVLVAMSYVSRNMDSVLGPKAVDQVANSRSQPAPAASDTHFKVSGSDVGVGTVSQAMTANHATEPKPSPAKPPQDSSKPKPALPSPAQKHQSSPVHRPPHRKSNSVRVYDPEK